VLPRLEIGDLLGGGGPGMATVAAVEHVPAEVLSPWLGGRLGGAPCPPEYGGVHGGLLGEINVCRVLDVLHAPAFGAIVDCDGRVQWASAREAMDRWPDLSGLPGARREGGETIFRPPATATHLAAASVFHPWGGGFNYGHFVLDALPSLLVLDELDLLGRYPPIAPALSRWRRDLLRLAFGDHLKVDERSEPVVRLGEAVYATSMDHFLHAPTPILGRLRERVLARAPAPSAPGARLYFSRRGTSMRVMVDEAAVEAGLRRRGFRIVHPERLSVGEQIALVREAEVIAGPTGAALANALFAPPSARVVEILPLNFASYWVRSMRHVTGGDWRGYFCESPIPEREVAFWRRLRRGFRFGYRTGAPAFLDFLDACL